MQIPWFKEILKLVQNQEDSPKMPLAITDYMTLLDEMAFKKNCCRINTSDDSLFFI
jgi:hypothetical protein